MCSDTVSFHSRPMPGLADLGIAFGASLSHVVWKDGYYCFHYPFSPCPSLLDNCVLHPISPAPWDQLVAAFCIQKLIPEYNSQVFVKPNHIKNIGLVAPLRFYSLFQILPVPLAQHKSWNIPNQEHSIYLPESRNGSVTNTTYSTYLPALLT